MRARTSTRSPSRPRTHAPSFAHAPERLDGGAAFVADPRDGVIRADDAESLAEEFIASVTGGDDVPEEARDEETIDELGGPFVDDDDVSTALVAEEPDEDTVPEA